MGGKERLIGTYFGVVLLHVRVDVAGGAAEVSARGGADILS